ncbi:2Fe-2S iron-sulfur cluster-binding protein [Streptomyces sp. NBC_00057]|uniref:(2Fe-2S)-binding protein n=1 Tax=Streptomyces sp. NBC_00057 TaxID=2975634 RepID=UPI00324F1DE6
MRGGLDDALAMALTSSLHIKDGIPLEGSWDNYFYTRQWNTPPELRVVVMPSTSDKLSGAGELGVAPVFATIACAYARATGTMSKITPDDEITTIEGLPATVGKDLHPMQEAWLDLDVAQCGHCQPGQIMAAVAKVRQAAADGREIEDRDLDEIRNICRCGTYTRIREAIKAGAENM